jgi:hypothetical protein
VLGNIYGYLIVSASGSSLDNSLAKLESSVQKHIDMGFEPIGGISVIISDKLSNTFSASQAVIIRDKVEHETTRRNCSQDLVDGKETEV